LPPELSSKFALEPDAMPDAIPLKALHHVGRLTKRLEESRAFYRDVLGFREIQRPNFDFPGAWLYNLGIQIHLIVNPGAPDPNGDIQTRCDHLALYSDDLDRTEALLKEHGIAYRTNYVAKTGVKQVFFRDPDGHHVEVATYPPTPAYV
jgi:glyoxylase I family protein